MRRKDCTVLDERMRFRARLLEGRRWPPCAVHISDRSRRPYRYGNPLPCRVETDILTLKRDK
jgi:hypothetical protein